MALLFADGFDYYGTSSDLALRWTQTVGFGTLVSTGQRNGTGKFVRLGGGVNLFKTLPGAYGTLTVGFAFEGTGSVNAQTILTFKDTTNVNDMVQLVVLPTGALEVVRANGIGTVLGVSAAGVVSNANWHYVEITVTFCLTTQSTGAVTVKVDGVSVLTATGVTTNGSISTNAATCSQFAFLGPSGSTFLLDDVYVCDTSGATNNDFLGDVNIVALMPGGAGHLQQWANTGGASQAASVAEIGPDGDTTYISDATVGDVSLFTLGSLPTGTTAVKGVCVDLYARKDDAGTRQIAPVLSNGTTDAVGATLTMPVSYSYQYQLYDQNPLTGTAWATGDFATLQAGVKVIA